MKNDFDDLNFSFDFDRPQKETVNGLVLKMFAKKRTLFNVEKEVKQVCALIDEPPKKDEVFKFLSCGGGFSSIGFINYVATLEDIEELYVSTFRIGKLQFGTLLNLHKNGCINEVHLITSSTQSKTDVFAEYKGKKYNYYEYIVSKCKQQNWKLTVFDNHSKLILMRTRKNWYVIETSSNLNENPKCEQFSFENDETLFNWYKELFLEIEDYAEKRDN